MGHAKAGRGEDPVGARARLWATLPGLDGGVASVGVSLPFAVGGKLVAGEARLSSVLEWIPVDAGCGGVVQSREGWVLEGLLRYGRDYGVRVAGDGHGGAGCRQGGCV